MVPPSSAQQRLDNFLARHFKDVPRAKIYRIIRRGEVRVNRGRVPPNHRLACGDEVRVPPLNSAPRQTPPHGPASMLSALEASVVHEDDQLLILNKPAGMAVHGGSGVRLGVIEALRQSRPEAPYLELAHRLDRDTSGCLAIAKRRSTLRRFHEGLRERALGKAYLCMVAGQWHKAAALDASLRKVGRGKNRTVRVDESSGKSSLTYFEPLDHWQSANGAGTLLRVELVTGRTHQIRVHAADAGHPLAGDDRYGDREFNRAMQQVGLRRLFLHAETISLPARVLGEPLVVHAPLGEELKHVLSALDCEIPQPARPPGATGRKRPRSVGKQKEWGLNERQRKRQ